MNNTAKNILEQWYMETECDCGIKNLTSYAYLIPKSLELCLESSENLNGLTLDDLHSINYEQLRFSEDLLILESGCTYSLDEIDYTLIFIIFLILYVNYLKMQIYEV